MNTLIASQVFIGIAVGFQQSFFWVVSEIVPMRWRYIANSYCYLMTTPTSPLAARVAYTFMTYPNTWRNWLVNIDVELFGLVKLTYVQLLLSHRNQRHQRHIMVPVLP